MNFCGLPRTDVETAVGRPVDGRIRILGFLLDIDVTGISAESHRAFAARGVGIELEFDQIAARFGVVDIQDANPADSIIQKLAVHLLDGVARRELVAVFGNDRIGRIVPGQRRPAPRAVFRDSDARSTGRRIRACPLLREQATNIAFIMSICKIYLVIVLGYDIVFERLDIISFVVLDPKQFSVIVVFIDLRMP